MKKIKIKFLLIRRKNSLTFIEFVRGRYKIDDSHHLKKLFKLMSNDEIKTIKETKDFTELWENLWKKPHSCKAYLKEYKQSKKKFNQLKNDEGDISWGALTSIISDYETPEWGFPKGRRNINEKNINCAIREFSEETGIELSDVTGTVLKEIKPINENFVGSNGVNYRHIYYISLDKTQRDLMINPENKNQNYEIGDIGWYSWEETNNLLRPYYNEKINILNQFFLFAINLHQQIKQKETSNNFLVI